MELNKIYLGDSLDLMSDIDDKSIDMVLSDPPYGISFCEWDKILDLEKMWSQYNRIVKPNGVIVLFSYQPFTSKLVLSNVDDFKYSLIWQKEKISNVFNVKKQFGRIHEDVVVFYKKQPTYNPQMSIRENVTNPFPMKGDLNVDKSKNITGVYKHSPDYNPNLTYPHSILKFNRDSKKGNPALHPTQKPVKLLEYLIKSFTNENDLVLDNTAGSSSTAIACLNTNRKFIMMEKDKNYFDISQKRIDNHKNKIK